MDPPNIFPVRNYTKCSSPRNYLFYGRIHHEILYIMKGKWYFNWHIIVSTCRWDISKLTRELFQKCCKYYITEFCRHIVTIVGYGLLRLSPRVPGALQPAKEQRNPTLWTDGCWPIADAPGTRAIQSLQSEWTVGENSFDIVKKCWNVSNNDHHVQS